MKYRALLATTITVIAAWVLPLSTARADSVLYDSAGVIQGEQSFVESFDIPTAETLTVSLSQISWLDTISDLNCFVTTAKGVLGNTMSGSGTESMNVQPGMIYVHWFGDANGQYGVGAYSLKVECATTPVGLPGTLILLLSGVGLLFGWQRRRVEPTLSGHEEALTV